MTTESILFIVLIIVLVGILPTWPHSKSWGYGPTGILMVLLVVLLIWALAGGRPLFRSSQPTVRTTIEDAGHSIKTMGRDVGDSIRDTVN
jgi:hypothetical protein